ncbi:MAG: hypothetical protein VX988_07845 [Planctomycetota bacterium]|nr:hypothetical protein [Planctomycetota bacterium]
MSKSIIARTIRHISFAIVCLGLVASPARSERASAPQLLPENTLAYLRIADGPDLVKRFKDTSIGRLGTDEQIRPLLTQLYGSVAEAFANVEDQVGSSLDELLSLPQGEIVIGLVGFETKRPSLVVLMDVGEGIETVNGLVERAREAAENDGAKIATEDVDGVELIIAQPQGDRADEPPAVLFIKEQTVVLTTDLEFSQSLLTRWGGVKEECLAKNKKFGAIMTRCAGKKDDAPQITWFVDPIELARNLVRGNLTAAAGFAFLPTIGLDGLTGIGGSVTLASESYDSVTHFHLLLENPRTGVLDMIALKGGKMKPESWVPTDVASYLTLHWDLEKTYNGTAELVDSFRGEGSFSAMVKQRVSDNIDIDFEEEIVPALAGRISHTMWYERPIRIGAETRAIGFELNDATEFSGTMQKAIDRFSERFTEKNHGGIKFHQFTIPGRQNDGDGDDDDDDDNGDNEVNQRRRPQPCVAVVGSYLIFTDRPTSMEKVINAYSGASESLGSQLDYKVIAAKARRLVGGREPSMITFDRPEERLRALYDLLTAESTLDWLAEQSDNPAVRAVNEALTDNPLPAFSVISRYLAPGGGILTNEETGVHYVNFVLRRNGESEKP